MADPGGTRVDILNFPIGQDISFILAVDDGTTAINLTTSGYTLEFRIYNAEDDPTAVIDPITPTVVNSKATNDGAQIDIADTLSVDSSGNVLIQPAKYWWELWRTNDGSERRLGCGVFEFVESPRR